MTIDRRSTAEENLGVLSVVGYLGPDAVRRFSGAIGWALARGTGPVIVDLTELRSWSAEGQLAITEAARRLAQADRSLELAAIPADGSLVPNRGLPADPGPRRPGHRARRTPGRVRGAGAGASRMAHHRVAGRRRSGRVAQGNGCR
ncbi:anti-sigma factor antagonist [Streptomyces flaveolus]|uniref:anti-sigma factor antagonist n=1 Tax=Streptomyces flaveolus TaxID=67297 RepID=UPI0033BA3B56